MLPSISHTLETAKTMVFCTKKGLLVYSAQHWSQCTRANTSQTTTNEGRCSNERSGVTPNIPPRDTNAPKKQTNKNKQTTPPPKKKKHASRSNRDLQLKICRGNKNLRTFYSIIYRSKSTAETINQTPGADDPTSSQAGLVESSGHQGNRNVC